jgi:hypothetical protein
MKPYPNYRDLESCHGVTWHELVDLDSRLADLLWDARHACVGCRRRSDVDQFFAPIHASLNAIFGWARAHPVHPRLGSHGAYQVAYWKLYDAVARLFPNGMACAERAQKNQKEKPVERLLPATVAAQHS